MGSSVAEQTIRANIQQTKIAIIKFSSFYKAETFYEGRLKVASTVVCKIVHKIASVWCKTASGEVGV